ncbi:MAG: hypothetical protein WKG01_10000 [Kofleriaceae bacterium]
MADNFNSRLYARGYAAQAPQRVKVTNRGHETPCCIPDCADCGLLECLCRPRFFAGQLLTEQDLNRLDAYVRAKNRLHTRHLHGWGVVNGLQVRCDSCGTGVIVGAGYAVDPCGEDIVVCEDTAVDICALIKRCQNVDITCVPSRTGAGTSCDELEEDWVLSIRYAETLARGGTALRSTPSCACGAPGGGCACGGSCGCGRGSCSCGGKKSKQPERKPRGTPAECEATAICEGYEFDAFLAPRDSLRPDNGKLQGGLIDRLRCCLEPLIDSLPKPPNENNDYTQNQAAWHLWCCRIKDALVAILSSGAQSNCTLVEQLQSLECPSPSDPSFVFKMQTVVAAFGEFLMEALLACICSALLPPAPCGTSDKRVPLAIVTVRKRDCKVLRVCNWTHLRKLLITMPSLEYWLGWIPVFRSIQDAVARFCCGDFELPRANPIPENPTTPGTPTTPGNPNNQPPPVDWVPPSPSMMKVNPELDPQVVRDNQTMASMVMSAIARGGVPIDPNMIVNGLFGVGAAAPQSMTSAEKANVAPFLLLNEVLRPVVASFVPDVARGPAATNAAGRAETASLNLRVAALEAAIRELGGRIP